MKILPPLLPAILLSALNVGTGLAAESVPANAVAFTGQSAALQSLSLDGQSAAFPAGGGFSLFDATAKRAVDLSAGRATAMSAFDCESDQLRLHAEFVPRRDYILVRGELENLRGDERGVIVTYRVPRLGTDAVFSDNLDSSAAMSSAQESEANVFPVAAMSTSGAGIGMAIPPNEPRDFGVVSSAEGLGIRFYLGLSPKPRHLPNRASFVFILYRIEPGSGFRGALSRYYGFFPEYYTPLLKQNGMFMYQMRDRMPANVDQYGFDMVEMQFEGPVLQRALERDRAHGITSFPYSLVGQREFKFLPALPKTYEGAMKIFQTWKLEDQRGHPITKENSTNDGDIQVKEEIESSALAGPDGRYEIIMRDSVWGKKSVSFKTNPNPDLFADQARFTVGRDQLAVYDRWLAAHPDLGGIFVDSLGANWPAAFNYRPDHFVYARYPLTVDGQGRVALQNTLSHYEFLETLRTKLRQSGRLVMGNGVYTYVSHAANVFPKQIEQQKVDAISKEFLRGAGPPEHYRGSGIKLGRFFISALLDAATSEVGIKATVGQCQDDRVLLGAKPYALINYDWKEESKIQEFVNKALCFGIYASTTTDYFSGVIYEDHPNGYRRDRALLDWYVPLVNALAAAGWEPIRHAVIGGTDIKGERFGRGHSIYFTLYNDGESAQRAELRIDLAALGFAPGNANLANVSEPGRLESNEPGHLAVTLQPKRTAVFRLTRQVR